MYLLYLLIAVLPLEEHWFWRMQLSGGFTIVKALGLACFLAALARIFFVRVNPHLFRGAIARWYFALLAIQCASYFLHPAGLRVDLSTYWHVGSIVMLLIVILTFVDSPARLYRTLLAGVCAGGFASLYTIRGQQLGGSGGRPSGIFADANYYALVVGLWIPLAFLLTFGRRPMWVRLLCFACFGLMLLGSLFAASRGGVLGLGAALVFLAWESQNRLRNFALLTALILPLLFYSSSSVLHRFADPSYGDIEAQDARLIAWRAGLRMIEAHPFAGVGLGNFKDVVEQYEDPDKRIISVAHNTYIEAAAELGIPGLLIQVGLLTATFLTLGRTRRHSERLKSRETYALSLGLQAGLISYIVGAFFVSTWWQSIVWLPIFLAISADRVSRRVERRLLEEQAARPRPEREEMCA